MRHKPAHRHCHACGATGREGTAHGRGALCGACGAAEPVAAAAAPGAGAEVTGGGPGLRAAGGMVGGATGAGGAAAGRTGGPACAVSACALAASDAVRVEPLAVAGSEREGAGECSWQAVERAVAVAAAERLRPQGHMFMPQWQCGVPTTTHLVRGGGGRVYFLRARVWEWFETRLWFQVQRHRARRALGVRVAELACAARWFAHVADRTDVDAAMREQARQAVGVLAGVSTAYGDYTAQALAATELRLTSTTAGVTHLPRLHWWGMAAWLQDYVVLGIGSALRRWPAEVALDNYRTASEVGTEVEYKRLWSVGYWEEGVARVRAPLGARLKPSGKWRTVYDATAGGLNEHVHRSAFPLPSFDDFAGQFYPACFMCKADFSDWFYHLPANEYTKQLLGVTDPHTGQLGRYRMYAMGLAETPHFANLFGNEVLRQVGMRAPFVGRRVYNPAQGSRAGEAAAADGLLLPTTFRLAEDGGLAADAKLYCDDVGICGRSWGQAAAAQVAYAQVTRDNGIVMSYPKSEGPSQRLPMLGLGIDVTAEEAGFTVFLPAKKRAALLQLLRSHRQGPWKGEFDTRRNLCSIVSKLYWTVPACPAAADQCRELWDTSYAGVDMGSGHMDYDGKVRITGQWKAAAWWWERLLADTTYTGETRRSTGQHPLIYGWSDASGSLAKAGGWGAVVHMRDALGVEHMGRADADFKGGDVPMHSTFKEMRGIEEQLKLLDSTPEWRARARGACLVAHTDCQPVACAIAKRRAHAVALRPLIRRIRALCARLDVQLETKWCSGERLIAQGCDSASRDHRLGVFADDAPAADSFLPTGSMGQLWSVELGAAVAEWAGTDAGVSFDPAAWDDLDALRAGVVLAPRATDTRRCIQAALDAVRSHEFELGLTVVAVASTPSDWSGLRKYFGRQLHVAPGERGLDPDAAMGVWFLQLTPPARPAVGGMARERVEDRVHERWRAGLPLEDSALLDLLTARDDAALAASALACTHRPDAAIYDAAGGGGVHGV